MKPKHHIQRENDRLHPSVVKLAFRVQELIDSGYKGSLEVVFGKNCVQGWHKHEFEHVDQTKKVE